MRNSFKAILLSTLLVSMGQWANAASEGQPIQHFVFLIHGLGGNIESFGHMQEALTKHLNESGELGNVAVKAFGYKTFGQFRETGEFALEFNHFIMDVIEGRSEEKYVADPDYRVSIVAHSQGGLVTTTLYYMSFLQAPYFHPSIYQRFSNIITLGSPFWGSKVASYAAENPWKFSKFNSIAGGALNPMEEVGELQILQMALGSSVIQRFRENLMKMTPREISDSLENIRILNVAGNANLKRISLDDTGMIKNTGKWWEEKWFNFLKGLLEKAFGLVEYEADMLVSLPSSTFNTITLKDHESYRHGQYIRRHRFNNYGFADRLIVRTVHASPWAEEIHDIVYTPEPCLTDQNCDHPTYKYVLNYLRGQSMEEMQSHFGDLISGEAIGLEKVWAKDNVKLQNFGGFTLATRVHIPEGYLPHRRSWVKVEMVSLTEQRDEKTMTPKIYINMKEEAVSRVRYNDSDTYPNAFVEWQTGHFDWASTLHPDFHKDFRKNGSVVMVSISAPGLKTRIIEAPVRPTLSTFIDVTLEFLDDPEQAKKEIQAEFNRRFPTPKAL